MDLAEANEEYEVVTSIPEKLLCEGMTGKSEVPANYKPPCYTESLESFSEYPEIICSQWIERIIQDTRPLMQWRNQQFEDLKKNFNGKTFFSCPIPHPYGDLPTANKYIKNNCGSKNSFTLETTLSREKQIQSEVFTADFFMHGVPPEVAIENYCQQHAYSRARLMRTDRRELANELLELMSTGSDTSENNIAYACRPASLLTNRFGNQRNIPQIQAVEGTQAGAVHASAYYSSRKNSKYSFDCHSTLSPESDNVTAAKSSVIRKVVKHKETSDCKTAWKGQLTTDINEPLKIRPCVFLPNEILSESRRKSIQRPKSVPKLIPTSTY